MGVKADREDRDDREDREDMDDTDAGKGAEWGVEGTGVVGAVTAASGTVLVLGRRMDGFFTVPLGVVAPAPSIPPPVWEEEGAPAPEPSGTALVDETPFGGSGTEGGMEPFSFSISHTQTNEVLLRSPATP